MRGEDSPTLAAANEVDRASRRLQGVLLARSFGELVRAVEEKRLWHREHEIPYEPPSWYAELLGRRPS